MAVAGTVAEMGAHWSRRQALGAGLLVPAVGASAFGGCGGRVGHRRAVLVRAADRPGQGDGATRLRAAPGGGAMAVGPVARAVSRNSLPPGQRPAAGRQPVLAPAVPSRLIPPLSGAGVRGRSGSGARGPLRPVVVRLRPGPDCRALGKGRGLRRLSRPLPVRGWRGPAGAVDLLGRQLLPGGGPRHPLRYLGARPRPRDRPRQARGVPCLHPFLGAAPEQPARSAADLCAAR